MHVHSLVQTVQFGAEPIIGYFEHIVMDETVFRLHVSVDHQMVSHFLHAEQHVLKDLESISLGDLLPFVEKGPEVTSIAEGLDDVGVVGCLVVVDQSTGVVPFQHF